MSRIVCLSTLKILQIECTGSYKKFPASNKSCTAFIEITKWTRFNSSIAFTREQTGRWSAILNNWYHLHEQMLFLLFYFNNHPFNTIARSWMFCQLLSSVQVSLMWNTFYTVKQLQKNRTRNVKCKGGWGVSKTYKYKYKYKYIDTMS